jgi:hypothetical protein
MKNAFLVFFALVAAVTLAVPQELKSKDLGKFEAREYPVVHANPTDLPPGAYWESEDVLVVRNDPLT